MFTMYLTRQSEHSIIAFPTFKEITMPRTQSSRPLVVRRVYKDTRDKIDELSTTHNITQYELIDVLVTMFATNPAFLKKLKARAKDNALISESDRAKRYRSKKAAKKVSKKKSSKKTASKKKATTRKKSASKKTPTATRKTK